MSRPDPASGSLEDILGSIRKSLAEQSTDALAEPAPVIPAEATKSSQRKEGLVGRLANATAGIPEREGRSPHEDDLSDVLETEGNLARAVAPAAVEAVAVPKTAASSDQDPLWFLTRSSEPESPKTEQAVAGALPAASQDARKKAPAETPLTRPEVVRASLPPFFGSSSEATKVETVSAAPAAGAGQLLGTTVRVEQRTALQREFTKLTDPAIAREVSIVAAAAETAAGGTLQSPGSSLLIGAGNRTGAASAAGTPYNHALEAMVLELLKPMMRQWLDQNMPRLVAAALKDEADRNASAEASAEKP